MSKKKIEQNALPPVSLVLGYIAVRENDYEDRILILYRLGYGLEEIATITGEEKKEVKETLEKIRELLKDARYEVKE